MIHSDRNVTVLDLDQNAFPLLNHLRDSWSLLGLDDTITYRSTLAICDDLRAGDYEAVCHANEHWTLRRAGKHSVSGLWSLKILCVRVHFTQLAVEDSSCSDDGDGCSDGRDSGSSSTTSSDNLAPTLPPTVFPFAGVGVANGWTPCRNEMRTGQVHIQVVLFRYRKLYYNTVRYYRHAACLSCAHIIVGRPFVHLICISNPIHRPRASLHCHDPKVLY